jgi:hypothetical protein
VEECFDSIGCVFVDDLEEAPVVEIGAIAAQATIGLFIDPGLDFVVRDVVDEEGISAWRIW